MDALAPLCAELLQIEAMTPMHCERGSNSAAELIVPYRKNVRNRRFEDKRKLRRYRKRWKIVRTNAWLQNFRRVQVRYDRILTVFQGFLHFACLLITLRHLCN